MVIAVAAAAASLSTMAFAQYAPNARPPGVTINGRGNPYANVTGRTDPGHVTKHHMRRHVSKRTRMRQSTTGQGSEQNPPLGVQVPPPGARTGSYQSPNRVEQTHSQ